MATAADEAAQTDQGAQADEGAPPESVVADEAADLAADSAAEPTGVPSVDAAVERLRDLASAPVEGHVEIFDDVQRRLHDALAELDDGQ